MDTRKRPPLAVALIVAVFAVIAFGSLPMLLLHSVGVGLVIAMPVGAVIGGPFTAWAIYRN